MTKDEGREVLQAYDRGEAFCVSWDGRIIGWAIGFNPDPDERDFDVHTQDLFCEIEDLRDWLCAIPGPNEHDEPVMLWRTPEAFVTWFAETWKVPS